NSPAHREDVGVVVLSRHSGRVEVVAERGPDAGHLVRGDLFALTAAAEDDPTVGPPFRDRSCDAQTDWRIVDRLLAPGSVIVNGVTKTGQNLFEVFFEQEPCVISADGDTHGQRLYYEVRSWFRPSLFRRAAKSDCVPVIPGSTGPTSKTPALPVAIACSFA